MGRIQKRAASSSSELREEAGKAHTSTRCYPKILGLRLKFAVEDHLKKLSVSDGSDSVKVDMDIRSWTESEEWDLILDKKELVVNFRLDFKSVISFTQ